MTETHARHFNNAETLLKEFAEDVRAAQNDPLHNPVFDFASRAFLALKSGEITIGDIGNLVTAFSAQTFERRAKVFHRRRRHTDTSAADWLSLVDQKNFDAFRHAVERPGAGIVFTAHPTFGLGDKKQNLLAAYADCKDEKSIADWRKKAKEAILSEPEDISLPYEHEEARKAIAHAQEAVRETNGKILGEARKLFPDQWRSLIPNPATLATWVGYDLDGRTDIHWGQSIRFRLEEKASQLERYASLLEAENEGADIKPLIEDLREAGKLAKEQAEKFAGDLDDPAIVVEAANFLTHEHKARLTTLAPTIEKLSRIIEKESDDERALALSLVRAEMKACGLGICGIHLRVNAAQVRSALRSDLGLDPETDFTGRSALDIASKKAHEVRQKLVNFGSVFLERMTARRQFMLCAQILKHIDADSPIRFLIAECEAPATVMGAVYLARVYGVEEKLDISPLFETAEAMERGGRFIERLLTDDEYKDYVKARKRIAIQIGYSDSGRYIGQAAASLAAERLQILFAKAVSAANLPSVEALVFNTHGESAGRGGHPGTFQERLNHLCTPWVKARFQRENIPLNCEYSFQGGDGFLHFQTKELAIATVSMIWKSSLEKNEADVTDQFYLNINYSWDIYRALKGWQEDLYENVNYRRMLFSFPHQTLLKTGSRVSKRESPGDKIHEARALRAIPNNAILQQIAAPANVSCGMGAASRGEKERFAFHVHGSKRMQELMGMVGFARSLTSVPVLRSYAALYSPAFWSTLADAQDHPKSAAICEEISQQLQGDDLSDSLDRLTNYLAQDLRLFDFVSRELDVGAESDDEDNVYCIMLLLHVLRQALIAKAGSLIGAAPDFSRRHDLDRGDLIDLVFDLKIGAAIEALGGIFPKSSPEGAQLSGLEEEIGEEELSGGAYPEIHHDIIEPLEEISALFTRISRAIADIYCAYG